VRKKNDREAEARTEEFARVYDVLLTDVSSYVCASCPLYNYCDRTLKRCVSLVPKTYSARGWFGDL
jgi:hypothetical protein